VLEDYEWDKLERACAAVPPPSETPAIGTDAKYPDYVTNLLLTVLDLQLHNVIVNRAIEHYWRNRWDEVRTLPDLERVLARFSDDRDGNTGAARYLWNYSYWNRAATLRGLTRWVRDNGITDQESLRGWALAATDPVTLTYRSVFEGQVKGLGIAGFCWLLMRLGVDTVKPDIWLHRFVKRVLGRDLNDVQLVEVITEAARRVGRQARELDAGIWESERGAPGSI